MSGAATNTRTAGDRVIQVVSLVVLFALLLGTTSLTHSGHGVGTLAAVGFLLLAGTLLAELAELVKLPHLSGYLIAGIIAGPHLTGIVGHEAVEQMSTVNVLALALIALAGGAELRIAQLRSIASSLLAGNLIQTVVVLTVMLSVFMAIGPYMAFTQSLPLVALFGVALMWGTAAVTRSPSACLGILSQTRASGPLATYSLGFIMLSDVVVVILLAAATTVAKPLVEPGAELSLASFANLGHELVGSISLGTTLGLLLTVYLRLVNKGIVIVLLGLGLAFSEVVRYLHFEPLLTFMVAGFVVQNLSKQGEKLLHAIEKLGALVYVLFFGVAGAHLDLPLLGKLWPFAVLLAGTRAVATIGANAIATRVVNAPPILRRWGWSALISQAGLALGLAAAVERSFPTFGAGFRALAIATVALNEMIGPVIFKLALDRTGETVAAEAEEV